MTTDTAPQPTGIRDGHTLGIVIDDDHIRGVIHCPFDGTDWAAVPFADRPACRAAYSESGQPEPDTKVKVCLVKEWYGDLGAEAFHELKTPFDVTELPVPVAYGWVGFDSDGFYVLPYRTEAAS